MVKKAGNSPIATLARCSTGPVLGRKMSLHGSVSQYPSAMEKRKISLQWARMRCAVSKAPRASILRKALRMRSEEHTSELQSLMRISYAVFCLKKKKQTNNQNHAQK